MLRICYSNSEACQRWKLSGQLAGVWVQELRTCWEHTPRTEIAARAVVDLTDVTFIDENGEMLLSDMRREGVEFVAVGVETRYLIEHLNSGT